MQRIRRGALLTAVLAGLFAPGAWATCYVVYGPDRQVVYRAQVPPVDMSRQVHETLPRVAPGGTMVFSPSNAGCELTLDKLPLKVAAQPAARRTAPAKRGRRARSS